MGSFARVGRDYMWSVSKSKQRTGCGELQSMPIAELMHVDETASYCCIQYSQLKGQSPRSP
jgi:hypothetical protein